MDFSNSGPVQEVAFRQLTASWKRERYQTPSRSSRILRFSVAHLQALPDRCGHTVSMHAWCLHGFATQSPRQDVGGVGGG